MEIRPEEPADWPAVTELLRSTFGGEEEVRLVDAVRASPAYRPDLALVGLEDGAIVGHAMCSYVSVSTPDDNEQDVLELAPVAVAPELQGRGIGRALINAGFERADAAGEPLVLVLGDPAYYSRFGFVEAASHDLHPPDEAFAPAFMVRTLKAYRPEIRGQVFWPPAFGA